MTPDEERDRGQRAERMMTDQLYVESHDKVRQAIIDTWEACPIRDREGAHELKLMLKLLGDLQGHIKTVMETGKMATITITQAEEAEVKRKGFLSKMGIRD